MSYSELTPTLLRQYKKPRMVEIHPTQDRAEIWECVHCGREFSFTWHHPATSLLTYTVDRAEELRDHLLLECRG